MRQRLPVIIMASDGDLVVHMGKHARRLVNDIKAAELRVVLNQGHMFHHVVPEQSWQRSTT